MKIHANMVFKDPVCGMDVHVKDSFKLACEEDHLVYHFCGMRCLKKFARQHTISDEKLRACLIQTPAAGWYTNKAFLVAFALFVFCSLSYYVRALAPFRVSLFLYISKIWWAVLLGLVFGGLIDYFVPREYVSRLLANKDKRTIVTSVFLGFLMSACSHGILALSIELHKKGASNPAVVAFLLASPWANLPLTIMFFGFFGLKALYIIICALVIALITGFIFQFLEQRQLIEVNKNTLALDNAFSIRNDIRRRAAEYRFSLKQLAADARGIVAGALSLSDMVLWWILIGIGLASLAAAYVPPNFFHQYMGPTMVGLLVTLVAATIIEVCSEGTAPLAFEIYRQTGALGNSFVFLMAGVVTDYTEIGLLWHNVGKRVALWLPIVTVPQVVLAGYIANIIFR